MNVQNQFYSSIAKHYSAIFPYRPIQLKFVKDNVGEISRKHILDIGCATGELAFQLAESGATVIGIDLNEDLLNQAEQNKKHSKLKFQQGNMLNLSKDFQPNQFDVVLCFGNTLVHLQTKELVQQMLKGVFASLKSGGYFLMQILNYDFILENRVSELPLIENESIRFIRNYKFQENSSIIRFETQLEIKAENKIVSNESSLLALTSEELNQALTDSGFRNIQFYANFKEENFGGKHLPLVSKCTK